MTNNSSTLLSAFNAGMQMNNVFVHVQPGVIDMLRAIRVFIRSSSPPRVIAMVSNVHVPPLKLLRAMGVHQQKLKSLLICFMTCGKESGLFQ